MTRPLTNLELARFLTRHPLVESMILETDLLARAGMYDYGYSPALGWKLPGVIPPWGLQVEDSEFMSVVIFLDRAGVWHYTGFSPIGGIINQPAFVSDSLIDPFGDLAELLKLVIAAGAGLLIIQALK